MNIQNVSTNEAYEILSSDKNSVLFDVRTHSEWQTVGFPHHDSLANNVHLLSIREEPDMTINFNFIKKVNTILEGLFKIKDNLKTSIKIFFICRSGKRSFQAASLLSCDGYENCYNIKEGFEGKNGWLDMKYKVNYKNNEL